MILDILTVLFFVLGFALILWLVGERRRRPLFVAQYNLPSVQYCTDICRRKFYSYRIELHVPIVVFPYA
jgi:hypothetical protein